MSVAGHLFASRFTAPIVEYPIVPVFAFLSCLGSRSRCFRLTMSLPGYWPLSQVANKANSVCSVFQTVCQIHVKDGTGHRHCSRNNPCPGSNLPHLAAAAAPATAQPVSHSQPGPNLPPQAASPSSTATPGPHSQQSKRRSSSHSDHQTPRSQSGLAHPASNTQTIKHIPKPARAALASALADFFDKTVAGPSDGDAWHDLLFFGARYRQQPRRGGKRRNTSSLLLKRLNVGGASLDEESNQAKVASRRSPEALRIVAISFKLEVGNISAAVRVLCSDDKPADLSAANLAKLQEKCPPAHAGAQSPKYPADKPALQGSEEAVLHAIGSCPEGSAGVLTA